jgi:large conductance mechanosensitive channel
MAEEEHNKEEHKKIIQKKEVVMTLPVVHAPAWLQGFVDFVREQGVVGVAVGLIIGLGAKSLVDSFVAAFVNPIVGFILGSSNLSAKYICIQADINGVCTTKLGWGAFINSLISFIIIVFIVYFVVKILKLDKLDKKKG